ncbi:MAG: hypothetical protein ACI8Q9_001977 [Planctomycetota bacterium]|jgi:hypothetical protein
MFVLLVGRFAWVGMLGARRLGQQQGSGVPLADKEPDAPRVPPRAQRPNQAERPAQRPKKAQRSAAPLNTFCANSLVGMGQQSKQNGAMRITPLNSPLNLTRRSAVAACLFFTSSIACAGVPISMTGEEPELASLATIQAEALGEATLPELCSQYSADRGSLTRLLSFPFSERRNARMKRLGQEWLVLMDAVDFEGLSRPEQVDWILLRGEIAHDLASLGDRVEREAEVAHLVPFADSLVALLEGRAARQLPEPKKVADVLAGASDSIEAFRESWSDEEEGETTESSVTPSAARRCASSVSRLRRDLASWYKFSAEYDPLFTWWVKAPWGDLEADLKDFEKFLEQEVGGIDTSDESLLLGDPIGNDALMNELAYERIAYTPAELIELAEREFAWCDERRREAADEMGLGDDWRAAQELVRGMHVDPGQQPALIRELSDEIVVYLTERNLIEIPLLADESWRMGMMSPARQKFTPYFTGGEVISIAYPTEGMDHDAKAQSMRGNNRHFSRATVHHELIPGHHLQGFMASRWANHRGMFRTPFLTEGWALYWELQLWDLGFPESPEDELGMLFWRAHRSARIIFSLNFHLGNWSAEECVDFLVERVGHDRNNAEAEVRRSIQGGYGPLYQAAYMVGGMQLYALHKELVEDGAWSETDFNEAVLRQNSIAPDLIRAYLRGDELTRDQPNDWRFPGVAE